MKGPGLGSNGVSTGPNGVSSTPTSRGGSTRESILQPVTDPLQSVESTRESLGSVGYLAGESTSLVSFLAAKLGKPVLVEGPAGAGESEPAEGRARGTGGKLVGVQPYQGVD